MTNKISFGLSVKEIKEAQKQLEQYQKSLDRKCELLVRRLAEKGITFANVYAGNSGFGRYVSFVSEITPEQAGCRAVVIAKNTGIIKSEWLTQDGAKTADVSPLLMLEFGSGLKANHPKNEEFGMGTGTFPDQTHAADPTGWWYMDLDGLWHHSFGIEPKMPMYKAAKEMGDNVYKIAKEVFGSS